MVFNLDKDMEAKDLMVGDWYYDKELNKSRMWHQLQFFEAYSNPTYMVLCQPLLLTEEILKANEFIYKEIDNEWWHYDPYPLSDFQIGYEDENDMRAMFNFDTTNIKVNYVHELQHALRMCGLNELADNFKLKEE